MDTLTERKSRQSEEPARPLPTDALQGLTSVEASSRLQKDGPNAMPDTSGHRLLDVLDKFWAPVPWLLEAAIVLQVVLHKYAEAGVIAILLVFNAALAFFMAPCCVKHVPGVAGWKGEPMGKGIPYEREPPPDGGGMGGRSSAALE